jgi:hypothetical protein
MGRYVLTRDIPASATEVFKAFTDPHLAADWMNAATIKDVSGPLDRAGSQYTLVIFGLHRFRSTVVRSEPPYLHETYHRGRLGASARMTAALSERDGITHLELDTDYTVPLGALGRWMDRRWLEHGPRTQANREIDRLVALVAPSPA